MGRLVGCVDGCIDPETDPRNCGDCGVVCVVPHASAVCEDTRCGVGICDDGWGDCDGLEDNGCETEAGSASADTTCTTTCNSVGTLDHTDVCNPTCTAPDETFFRAFPEWRAVTSVGWNYSNFSGLLRFRWVDEMDNEGDKLDSATFTDLRLTWTPGFANDALALSLGFNNVFDEDPPVCQNCGVIGINPVVHDLPGRVGYLRVSYQQ